MPDPGVHHAAAPGPLHSVAPGPLHAAAPGPRIAPGDRAQIGLVNDLLTRAIGLATGGGPPNAFTTLALHRVLFRPWLRFAGALMPGGMLPRVDTEIVILRVARNTGCAYEAGHHEHLAALAGLSPDQIAGASGGSADAPVWSPRQSLLLRAADELHAARVISDALWSDLRPLFSDAELIELCMLIGHYEMLAMTFNTLRIEPDLLPDPPPPVARAIQAAIRRFGRRPPPRASGPRVPRTASDGHPPDRL